MQIPVFFPPAVNTYKIKYYGEPYLCGVSFIRFPFLRFDKGGKNFRRKSYSMNRRMNEKRIHKLSVRAKK